MAQLQVRIDPDLHELLRVAAKEDHRSLNGEILWLIERGLEQRDR